MSTNFLTSKFPLTLPFSSPHNKSSSSLTMATCIHSSRTKTPSKSSISHDPNKPQLDNHVYNYVKYYKPNFPDLVSYKPISQKGSKVEEGGGENNNLWLKMKDEARSDIDQEPILSSYYVSSVLAHDSMERALANHLAMKLSNSNLPSTTLYDLFMGVLTEDRDIIKSVEADLRAVKERDPACISYVHCFLNFKGFLACQAHRIAHKLWTKGRNILALLIQNRVSEVFAVDIHPGAKIGKGVMLDHATGVVVGETAVIGNNVSILHNVTLGGTGKVCGDRHPKIGDGVLIGAGTCVLGNVRIGDGAKIGAGSVVLKEVPERTTAVGNPARLLGGKENPKRLDKIPSLTMDHTSHISDWAKDTDNLYDVCPSDTTRKNFFINGYPCKNPAEITASDFKSSALSKEGDTDNFQRSSTTLVTAAEFAGLNTLGLSVARTDLDIDGVVMPHAHPRASEMMFVGKGVVIAGFIDTKSQVFQKNLKEGEVFIVPRGLLHYTLNSGFGLATVYSVLSSQNPGLVSISDAMFAPVVSDHMNELMKRMFSRPALVRDQIKNLTLFRS